MVVLAIIGGIMALVATNIIGSASDSRIKTTKAQIKLLEKTPWICTSWIILPIPPPSKALKP